jgi:hypothetical protein
VTLADRIGSDAVYRDTSHGWIQRRSTLDPVRSLSHGSRVVYADRFGRLDLAKRRANDKAGGSTLSGSLNFLLTLPSGSSATPKIDRWTFHHVLPRRYYFFCAYTLVMAARHQCTDQNQLNDLAGHSAYPAIRRSCETDAKVPAYGSKSGDFGRLSLTAGQLIELLKSMASDTFVRILSTHGLDGDAIAATCRAPKFGGFAGMHGAQRADDPNDRAERIPPNSANGRKDWWSALCLLKQRLNACCKELPDATGGKEVEATAQREDVEGIISQLNILTRNHNGVHPFFAGDWDYKLLGSKQPWVLIDKVGSGQEVAPYFELNNDGQGGKGLKDPLRFMRPPPKEEQDNRPERVRENLLYHAP